MKLVLIFLLPFFIITGTVFNQKTGERMPNVNVFETVSNIGTITDSNGQFKLILNKNEVNIIISEHEFEIFPINLVLKSDTCVNVKLKPSEIKRKFIFR